MFLLKLKFGFNQLQLLKCSSKPPLKKVRKCYFEMGIKIVSFKMMNYLRNNSNLNSILFFDFCYFNSPF